MLNLKDYLPEEYRGYFLNRGLFSSKRKDISANNLNEKKSRNRWIVNVLEHLPIPQIIVSILLLMSVGVGIAFINQNNDIRQYAMQPSDGYGTPVTPTKKASPTTPPSNSGTKECNVKSCSNYQCVSTSRTTPKSQNCPASSCSSNSDCGSAPTATPTPGCVGEGGVVASGTGNCCSNLVKTDCASGSFAHCYCRKPAVATATPTPTTRNCTIRLCSGNQCLVSTKTIPSSQTCPASNCVSDTSCKVTTTQQSCDGKPSGTQECNSSKGYNYCKNGTWYSASCASGTVCSGGQCIAEKIATTLTCDGKPSGTQECNASGGYNYCENGSWHKASCPSGTSCTNGQCITDKFVTAMTCDGKANGTKQCNTSGGYNYCKNGTWYASSCASGTTCTNGECITPRENISSEETLIAVGQLLNKATFGAAGNYIAQNVAINSENDCLSSIENYDQCVKDSRNLSSSAILGSTLTAEGAAAAFTVDAALGGSASLGAYSYATSYLSSLPAGAQTALSAAMTALAVSGAVSGTTACAIDPYSDACIGYIVGLQTDPLAMAQLGEQISSTQKAVQNQYEANYYDLIYEYIKNRPEPNYNSVLNQTTEVIARSKDFPGIFVTASDARLATTVDEIRDMIGDQNNLAGGLYVDDISSAIYKRNQSVYGSSSEYLFPWQEVGTSGTVPEYMEEVIPKMNIPENIYQSALLGDTFGKTSGCVGNVCYQNAQLLHATAATYGMKTELVGIADENYDFYHEAVRWTNPDNGILMLSDPTWNITMSQDELLQNSINFYYRPNLGIADSQIIFIPKVK
jgi:hypothetical protein